MEFGIAVVQDSDGSDTDPELDAKARRFAAAKRQAAEGSLGSLGASQSWKGPLTHTLGSSVGMPMSPVVSRAAITPQADAVGHVGSRSSPRGKMGSAGEEHSPPKRSGLRVATEAKERDVRGLLLGFDCTPKYVQPPSSSHKSRTKASPSQTVPVLPVGQVSRELHSPGPGCVSSRSIGAPSPRQLPDGGVFPLIRSPGPTGSLAKGSKSLASSTSAPSLPSPQPGQGGEGGGPGDYDGPPPSPGLKSILVPASNVAPVEPPAEVYEEALRGTGATEAEVRAGMPGTVLGTVVRNVRPGILGRVQVRARNQFGWGPFSPVATFMLDPAPTVVSVTKHQVVLRCAIADRQRLFVQKQVALTDVADGCCGSPPWHDELVFGDWEDVLPTRDNMEGLVLTISGLEAGTRYRFRQRSRTDVEWDQCPLTDAIRTQRKLSLPLHFPEMHSFPWEDSGWLPHGL